MYSVFTRSYVHKQTLSGGEPVTYTVLLLLQTLLVVSYADCPEIDSCNTSYKLSLAPSAGLQQPAVHLPGCGFWDRIISARLIIDWLISSMSLHHILPLSICMRYYRRRESARQTESQLSTILQCHQFYSVKTTPQCVHKTPFLFSFITLITSSSAVAKRPRDASCLTVVSFNIPTAQFF